MTTRRKCTWTANENQRLEWLWGDNDSIPTIASKLGRTSHAVYRQARRLGLKVGVPQGWEGLAAAAKRVGLGRDHLIVILERYGVPVVRTMSDPTRQKRTSRGMKHHRVRPELVDEALEKWMKAESLASIAERYGLSTTRARQALDVHGIERRAGRNGGKLFLDPEVVERVMRPIALELQLKAARAKAVKETAARYRVSTKAVNVRFAAAGIGMPTPEKIERAMRGVRVMKRNKEAA